MLAVSIQAMRRRNMSVSTPAGTFIAPIAALCIPTMPPTAMSVRPSASLMCGSSISNPCW